MHIIRFIRYIIIREALKKCKTRPGIDKVKPKVSTPYRMTKKQCWTVPPGSYLHGRPAFGPSCTEFVYPGCWHFDNGALSEHGKLLLVLPLAFHLNFFMDN